jgi:hypothetical protein
MIIRLSQQPVAVHAGHLYSFLRLLHLLRLAPRWPTCLSERSRSVSAWWSLAVPSNG